MRNLILSTLTASKKINLVSLRIYSVPAHKMADEPELNIMKSKIAMFPSSTASSPFEVLNLVRKSQS